MRHLAILALLSITACQSMAAEPLPPNPVPDKPAETVTLSVASYNAIITILSQVAIENIKQCKSGVEIWHCNADPLLKHLQEEQTKAKANTK